MTCPEYLHLQQEYEASLRRWGEAMLSQVETAPQLRLKAYQGRFEARRKLGLHEESCPTCNDTMWKTIDTLLENEHLDDDPDDVY
jgi:hypothetical protein